MKFSALSGKISAQSNEFCWGGCFSENGIFVLLEVTGDENYSAQKTGRELLDKLLEKFTQFKQRNLSLVKNLLDEFINIDSIKTLTIGLLKDDILYLGNKGHGKVFIQRNGIVGELLSYGERASGKVKVNDVFLFTSFTFEQVLKNEDIVKLLEINNPQEVIEKVAPVLLDNEKAVGAAALSLLLKQEFQPTKDIGDIDSKRLSNTLSTFFHRLSGKNWLKDFINRALSKSHQRAIDESKEKTKKTLLTIAIILVILLISSIFLNINFAGRSGKTAQLQETIALVSHQYEEAVNLVELNPVRARLLLSDSKLSLLPLVNEFEKNSEEAELISDWLEKISQQEIAAYNIFKLSQVPLFYDLTLLKKEGEGKKIVSYREKKAILDTTNKVIYILSTDTKQGQILAGENVVGNAQVVTIHGKEVYILNENGIVSINIDTPKSKNVVKTDKDWGEIVDIAVFAANVYLLDRSANSIWKYIAADTGFSSKKNYLTQGVVVDFSDKNLLIIDGSVYVSGDEEVLKFRQGAGEPFVFQGLSDTISGSLDMFTSDDEENLYVLDRFLSRILVFDKDGQYKAQYQWDELSSATDFVVSEKEKKIFVLMGSRIYGIDLE